MRETALLHPRLIQLLLLLWLVASCLTVVHAADHFAEATTHDCAACLVNPDLAGPSSPVLHRLPPAAVDATPTARTRKAQNAAPRTQHARAPPTTA